jgi:GNAT superfamily N-acetyltransferase
MITIRPVVEDDFDALNARFVVGEYFARRLVDARAGRCVLLAAWDETTPVAHGYLWEAAVPESPQHLSALEPVRAHLPGVPLLQNLQVAADQRRRGIGRLMVAAIERAAVDRGHRRIALGVDPDNVAARRLYLGLDYHDWPHGLVEVSYDGVVEDGVSRTFTEFTMMMVKELVVIDVLGSGQRWRRMRR